MSEPRDVPFSTATLDPEDQAILGALTPEGPEPGTPAFGAQTERELEEAAAREGAGAPAPADAPAAPAPAPAAPAPAAPAPSSAPAAPAPAPTDAPAPAPGAPAPSPAPTPAPAPADQGGDARAALRHARRNEKRLAQELADANARIRALEEQQAAGGGTQGNGDRRGLDQMSAEEIEDLKTNFPLQYQMLEELRDLRAKVDKAPPAPAPAAPAPAPAEWQPTFYAPEVQEVIDEVPTLLRWQLNQADQPKFDMAATFDTSLRADPAWANKPPAERFAEAVRLTELRLGLTPGAAPAPAPAPAASRADPAAAIAAAPSTQPAGISDFRGGGPAGAPALDFSRMSDEQILGSLQPEP